MHPPRPIHPYYDPQGVIVGVGHPVFRRVPESMEAKEGGRQSEGQRVSVDSGGFRALAQGSHPLEGRTAACR